MPQERNHEIRKASILSKEYPSFLKEIPKPPNDIFYIGDLSALKGPCIAIVGTRRCTQRSAILAKEWARILSLHGVCIVSGLAYGIDAAAHRGALEAKKPTIAVLAQALPDIQPAAHRELAMEIIRQNGAIISEKPKGGPSFKSDYLVRNRIISGLSRGVLIIEAGFRSGAINTAYHALDQNRDVLAVPGRPDDEMSMGCNKLIQNGAKLVTNVDNVLDFLGIKKSSQDELNVRKTLSDLAKEIYEAIRSDAKSAAEICEEFQGSTGEIYMILSELEIQGLIKRGPDLLFYQTSVKSF